MVTYLCTFATYETLNQMIQEISNLDKLKLTRLYLKRLAAVQNEHHTSGVMENILELLCASPLPLSKNDIVDAIYLSRSKEERCATDDIRKEVDFSLAFAQDYIEEHNGRFTITDETVKTVMLFDKIEGTSEQPLFQPKLCSLMLALRTVYVARLYSKDQICNEDAENLCEIIKDFSSPDFRSIFYHTVIKDMKTFFKLASALSKRALVDLFKTLSLQSMGYDVESYFSKEIKRVMEVEENPIGQTQSVLREKLFSVSRSTQPENIFLSYYAVAIGIGDGDLSSYERFVTFINGNLFTDAQKLNYHILHLPANWNITSGNTTCYTIFDVDAQSYITYCCHCENGFAIICDVLTSEEKKAYALARNVGEVVATFYQNHTIHIIYENGVITVINTNTNMVNTYRFAKEDTHITWFLHDYPNEYQVAVSNNNTIEIYHKLRKVGYISLQEGLEALSVHVLSYQDDLPKKLVFIAKNEVGNYFCCLFDFQENKTTYTRSFANHEIIGILQDEKTRDIYVETNHGFSFVLRYNGGEDLVVDLDIEQLYCADDSLKIVQYKENIFCNDELIVRNAHAICRFSSRKMIGFITTDNTLYIFDNGY
jgi:hypothetical protein